MPKNVDPLIDKNSAIFSGDKPVMNNFKVMKGDMDNAIAVMNEVARWCENTGKKMWTMDEYLGEIHE